MKQYFKAPEVLDQLKPEDMGMVYTSLRRLEIKAPTVVESGEEELCFVCIEGSVEYQTGEESGTAKMMDMLYLPIHSQITFSSAEGAVVMKYGAPCDRDTSFALIRFEDVDKDSRHKVYGKVENGNLRDVWNYIDEQFDSSRFLTGICRGSDGGWTAWPPHEHAAEREETYVYFNMGTSFGAQFVYDDLGDPQVAAIVQDGDVVSIPHGYHPNVGCPCGGICYAYVMVSTVPEVRDFMTMRTQTIYGDRLE